MTARTFEKRRIGRTDLEVTTLAGYQAPPVQRETAEVA